MRVCAALPTAATELRTTLDIASFDATARSLGAAILPSSIPDYAETPGTAPKLTLSQTQALVISLVATCTLALLLLLVAFVCLCKSKLANALRSGSKEGSEPGSLANKANKYKFGSLDDFIVYRQRKEELFRIQEMLAACNRVMERFDTIVQKIDKGFAALGQTDGGLHRPNVNA
ncbi:hypothetical protein GGI07_005896 [Coemansia sp. Benny D115]|nr:hypothetical protein GGI07_005896 [Coemansia sp. Benny D115]